MQKKIIAICCAVVIITVLLASCGNNYAYIESNGSEYPVVTDAEGNTETNLEGKIAVYVTDSSGDVVTNADGSAQKNYVDFPDVIASGNTVETSLYKFTMPDGWTVNSLGKFIKDGTEDSTVKIYFEKELDGGSFDAYVSELNSNDEALLEQVKTKYPDAAINNEEGTLSDGSTRYIGTNFIVKDSTGAVVYYTYSVIFEIDGSVYAARYICNNGADYDETFDFKSIVEQNLTIK